MSKYADTVGTESCTETKKDLKARIKQTKLRLKDFIELTNYVDMSWDARTQIIGSLYLDLVRMQDRYNRKTSKSK